MTENVQTSTLIFDFNKSDFAKLQSKYEILEYDIPGDILPRGNNDYEHAKFHTLLKDICGDIPYYANKPSKKFYTCQEINSTKTLKREDGDNLDGKIFTEYLNPQKTHCFLNVLLAKHFYMKERYNNNVFYLIVSDFKSEKKQNEYINVLRLEIKHNFKSQNSPRYELWIKDSGTRMKSVKKSEYQKTENGTRNFLQNEIPYAPRYNSDGSLVSLKQMSRKDIHGLKPSELACL
jgi:hypothetical protein